MKKLFSIKDEGFFQVEVENKVYSVFNRKSNSHRFFDAKGNSINYQRKQSQYNITKSINNGDDIEPYLYDQNFVSYIGEGFYIYSTHEIHNDPDGIYGLFEIKNYNGEKLTEEIYYQVGDFCNGLCSVCITEGKWGCINKFGELVIPYKYGDIIRFNKYGIACADNCLIDIEGNAIPDTSLNLEGDCGEYDRYFTFGTTTAEQDKSISRCGTAEDILLDIYDTKTRKYVAKGIPECCLDVSFYDGEPEVILAAIELISQYETVDVCKSGTILARKDGWITVFYYY